EIETEGRSSFYGPGGAWFESGADPVLARASAHLATSFVRVLVLPAEWPGKRTITSLDPPHPADPKQTATVLLEHAIALPRCTAAAAGSSSATSPWLVSTSRSESRAR